jgi:hypothetical protein
MTAELVTAPPPAKAPDWISQATAVEQSRAVAEVQAAVVVAQQVPRVLATSIGAMRESCRQIGLARRAFYRYNKGGSQVSGASVHLARELARCWGNVQYGVQELRRDDDHGLSEMQAWAWDVQTNTRSLLTFVVPHKRDKTGGVVKLTDLRDVYENNANMGARRLREAIFSILPAWFTDEAKEIATQTLEGPGEKPLAQRAASMVSAFAELGVTQEQLETKLGRQLSKWTGPDIATLQVIGQSLRRNEVTIADEFPQRRVTAAEIAGQAQNEAPDA